MPKLSPEALLAMQNKATASNKEFHARYMLSTELSTILGVTKQSLTYAMRAQRIPLPIELPSRIYMWERKVIQPYIDSWEDTRSVGGRPPWKHQTAEG